MFGFFKKSKEQKIRKEREQNKKIEKTERNVIKTTAIQKQALSILDSSNANYKDLQEQIQKFNNEVIEFQKKVDENQKLQIKLQEKEAELNKKEEELKDKADKNRKEEMSLHIRKESIKKDDERLKKKDRDLDGERENIQIERKNIKEREIKSEKAIQKAEESKEKYDDLKEKAEANKRTYETKLKDLDDRESNCKKLEDDIEQKLRKVSERERLQDSKEAELKQSFEEKEKKLEQDRADIENKLNEKIKEYDRKIADIEAIGETIDNIKFDDSEDGRKAKIVVKETIRASMKALEDTLGKFKELDEKYASGTFKGFSIPIEEISNDFQKLKFTYNEIKENAGEQKEAGFDFDLWVSKIEESIEEADKNHKSHLYAEAYRQIIEGISYCNGYETMVKIFFSMYQGEEQEMQGDDKWENYYEILFEEDYDSSVDYTTYDLKALKKQHRKMVKKYHTDRAPNDKEKEYKEKMQKINEIWEILANNEKREEYNKTYTSKKQSY